MPEIINGKRKVWNPLSRYYVEPFGEWLGTKLAKTGITPNAVTLFNTATSSLAGLLVYFGGTLNLILFALIIQWFHALDISDGQIARLTGKKSKFGKWIDRAGDRFVMNAWMVVIGFSLYAHSGKPIFLIATIVLFFGKYLYSFLSLTSDIDYGQQPDSLRDNVKRNPLTWIFLLFIDFDIQQHLLSLAALANKFDWYVLFYAVYFNLIWIAYFLYFFFRHIKTGE